MVHRVHNHAVQIEVCNVSFQRHSTSLLNRRQKKSNTLHGRSNMEDHSERQPLPVVELRPFSKKVWRREKSLPDFYDKKRPEECPNASSNSNRVEATPASSRLVCDFTDARKNIESRQNTFDSSLGKFRSHPKAEFLHESNRAWRKQDLIPSFITRFERTKTSLESLSRDNTFQKISFEKPSMFENALKREPNPAIRINGGRMTQQIHRRHLLYLNPLESYRQPSSWVSHYNTTDPSRQDAPRDKYLPSRHSFPLTSSRTRDLILGDSQAQYPLKPIRREDAESPHKFNSKLGAAKNSLEVLSKIGIQTRLEKTLEKEMEINLEKFRKDRLLLSGDLKCVPFQYLSLDSNLTRGELSLRHAREANKPAKGKPRPFAGRKNAVLLRDVGYSGPHDPYNAGMGAPHVLNASVIDPIRHVISQPLVEEGESRSGVGSHLSEPLRTGGGGRGVSRQTDSAQGGLESSLQTAPGVDVPPQNQNVDTNGSKPPSGRKSSREVKPHASAPSAEDGVAAHDRDAEALKTNTTMEKDSPQILDSSRIETNVAYLENLQLKSSLSHLSPDMNKSDLRRVDNDSRFEPTDPITNEHRPDFQETQSTSRDSHYTSLPQLSPTQSSHPLSPHDPPVSPHSPSKTPHDQLVSPHSPSKTPHDPQVSPHSPSKMLRNPPVSPQSPSATPLDPVQLGSAQSLPHQRGSPETLNEPSTATPTQERPYSEPNALDSTTSNGMIDGNVSHADVTDSLDDGREISQDGEVGGSSGKRRVEVANPSPLTSSGIESQPTTDQEDEFLPNPEELSNRKKVIGQGSLDQNTTLEGVVEDEIAITAPSVDKDLDAEKTEKGEPGDSREKYPNVGANQADRNDGNTPDRINIAKEKQASSASIDGKRVLQYSPGEDEGISLAANESAILDSSVTEVYSEQDGQTGCADNGDSGVSTTFLTSEESVPVVLEGIMSG